MARSNPFSTGRLRPRCAPFINQHGNTTGKLREKSKKNSVKSKKKTGRRTNIKDSPLIINKLKYKIYENGFKSQSGSMNIDNQNINVPINNLNIDNSKKTCSTSRSRVNPTSKTSDCGNNSVNKKEKLQSSCKGDFFDKKQSKNIMKRQNTSTRNMKKSATITNLKRDDDLCLSLHTKIMKKIQNNKKPDKVLTDRESYKKPKKPKIDISEQKKIFNHNSDRPLNNINRNEKFDLKTTLSQINNKRAGLRLYLYV